VVQHVLLLGLSVVLELQEFAKQLLRYQLDHSIIVRVYRATTEEIFCYGHVVHMHVTSGYTGM
jgi:hypothetical protein